MISRIAQATFILCAVLFFAQTNAVFAADGDLDLSFDTDGIVITDNASSLEGVVDLAVQPDGKSIAVGFNRANSMSAIRTVIVRYNPDGSIDTGFGASGKVFIESVFPSELALQPNGKIVLVGEITPAQTSIYVARLNSDGSPDATFNGTGALTLFLRGTSDGADSIKVQPDGKILVGGSSVAPNVSISRRDFALVRLNPDGSLDATFDGDGKVFTLVQENAGISNLMIQSDGKIVAVGESFVVDTASNNSIGSFATVRYNSNGSLDTAFNNSGTALAQFVSNGSPGARRFNTPETVLARANGKILVVGTTGSCCAPQPLSQVAIIQYNADGTVDSSFGAAGKIQTGYLTFPTTTAFNAAIQADNKIVIGGIGQPNNKSSLQAAVARFTANGSLDSTFNGDGWSMLQFPTNIASRGDAVEIQPDGKILLGGTVITNSANDFLLARFTAANNQRIADFDGDGKTDASVYRSGTWLINPSGANNPSSYYGTQFGLATDKLTPADFDGDGKTDLAVWRDEPMNPNSANFYILNSRDNTVRIEQFGSSGDDPRFVGDWDGDTRADLAVYRSGAATGAQSVFYYRPSSQPNRDFVAVSWGIQGDEAVRGDFDGDGKQDAAVFRPSNNVWYILNSSNNQPRFENWGLAADKRIAGDFDGDGKTDLTVFRDGVWYVLQSSNNQPRYQYWGLASDKLVPGDYDGDGQTDFAIWRAGVYYILRNSNSQAVYQSFGASDDVPVASAFVR